MNKFFATIALAALAFTGCIKENETYKELLPVQPGMRIYELTMNQNTMAMQPANAGLRLAMLLAEADKQGADLATVDLKAIKSGTTFVWNSLFAASTSVERQGEDYLIKYGEGTQQPNGIYMKGAVLIRTNGAKLLNTTSPSNSWVVELQDLKMIVQDRMGGIVQTFHFDNGQTRLYYNGGDAYTVEMMDFRTHIDDLDAYSSWSGNFILRVEDSSLAFSLCAGKDFKIDGRASGPTMYSSDVAKSVQMQYDLSNGVYRGSQIITGKQICSFLSSLEYDRVQFPSPEVTYDWTMDASGRISFKIYYNGAVYPKN